MLHSSEDKFTVPDLNPLLFGLVVTNLTNAFSFSFHLPYAERADTVRLRLTDIFLRISAPLSVLFNSILATISSTFEIYWGSLKALKFSSVILELGDELFTFLFGF